MALKMTREDLQAFISEVFPQVAADFTVEDVAPMQITMRLNVGERHLRPGGTISGPSMFGLADVAIYLAIMAMIGPKALAVTTNASFDFMRKPAAGVDLIAKCRLLKLGRVLAVGDVLLYSEGDEAPVARAAMTYSIPPER
jgi:uncharacterized protein (TIGR00369 family)